jgi:prepilin-type N-terminal cleavage/methylation domain-containing protein
MTVTKLSSGLTLVEVLISIAILTVGCFSAISLHSISLSTSSSAFHLSEASNLAKAEIERLKSLSRSQLENESKAVTKLEAALDSRGVICPSGDCNGTKYSRTVRYFERTPTSLSTRVEVEIRWLDSTGPKTLKQWAVVTWLTF